MGGSYFMRGDWHDVLMMPNSQSTVRFQADRFTGRQVLHCHKWHEDMGMMAVTELTGEEGTLYSNAETIDETCYRGAFPSDVDVDDDSGGDGDDVESGGDGGGATTTTILLSGVGV